MKGQKRNIPFPENLQVKALIVIARRDITELADTLNVSRNWLNRVLNGHELGADILSKVKAELDNPTKQPATA